MQCRIDSFQSSKKQALIIGAGAIGRGCVAPILARSGFEVVFACSGADRAHRLNTMGGYSIRFAGSPHRVEISNIRAVDVHNTPGLIAEAALVDLVFTSVRVQNLLSIVPAVCRLIQGRLAARGMTPLNIIFWENLPVDETPISDFKRAVESWTGDPDFQQFVHDLLGYVGAVVEVTVPGPPYNAPESLDVIVGGEQNDILLDSMAIKGSLPLVMGIRSVPDLRLHRERKLLIHGLGHATLAYLSAAKGITLLADGMCERDIALVVSQAMEESARALEARYPAAFRQGYLDSYVSDLLASFSNSSLHDTVERVGRDPWRKLRPGERFLGALENAVATTGRHEAIRIGLRAALEYACALNAGENTVFIERFLPPGVDAAGPLNSAWRGFVTRAHLGSALRSFIEPASDMRLFPRVLVLDVDGTLTDLSEGSLRPDLAHALLRVRDLGVHIVFLSGISRGRFEENILPVLRSLGDGNNVSFFGGCGAFGLVYDDLWNARELHSVGFREFREGPANLRLLSDDELGSLVEMVQKCVPAGVPLVRDSHIAVRLADANEAISVGQKLRRVIESSGVNASIQQPLAAIGSFLAKNIAVRVRVSRGSLVNVLLVTKDIGLQLALGAIEASSRGFIQAHHTLLIDDSLNGDQSSLSCGLDLLRPRDGQLLPIALNVGGGYVESALQDAVITLPRKGPEATEGILKTLVAMSRAPCAEIAHDCSGQARRRPTPSDEGVHTYKSSPHVLTLGSGLYLIPTRCEESPHAALGKSGACYCGEEVSDEHRADKQMQGRLEEFDQCVKAGRMRPIVIVPIKDLYPGAAQLYLQELLRFTQVYNGNVTCFLSVQPPDAIRHDLPSVFSALQAAKAMLGELFYEQPTLVIADAGRKTRNAPLTLRHGFQGLFPYSLKHSYFQEAFARAGVLLLQMPYYGRHHVMVVASDSIFDFTNLEFPLGWSMGKWASSSQLLIPLAPVSDLENASEKVIADVDEGDRVLNVLAKPSPELMRQSNVTLNPARLWTLPFATVWPKRELLDAFILALAGVPLSNGQTLLHAPTDLFRGLIEGLYSPSAESWGLRRMPGMSAEEWAKLRTISISFLGRQGSNVTYALMRSKNAFLDEGNLRVARRRLEAQRSGNLDRVAKTPRVHLCGAFFLTGDRVVIRGRGDLRIGNRVQLSNVLIDIGDGGVLEIPDGWTLHDCYLGGRNQFVGVNGWLTGVFRCQPTTHCVLPVVGQAFRGECCNTVVLTRLGDHVRVEVPLGADKRVLASLRFGRAGLTLEDLQDQTDVLAASAATRQLKRLTDKELVSAPPIFPLEKGAARTVCWLPHREWIGELAREIIARKMEPGLFWVTIEGLQGAGKSYLGRALRRELRARGQSAVLVEEDWSHLSRLDRESMRHGSPKLWACHRESWHDWDKNRATVDALLSSDGGYISLRGQYNRATGLQDLRRRLHVRPNGVVIYTGFYIADCSLHGIPTDRAHLLKVYMGITQDDSLAVKRRRDRWRHPGDIVSFDAQIYRPAFGQYTRVFNPAGDADYVLRVDSQRRGVIEIVRPLERRIARIPADLLSSEMLGANLE